MTHCERFSRSPRRRWRAASRYGQRKQHPPCNCRQTKYSRGITTVGISMRPAVTPSAVPILCAIVAVPLTNHVALAQAGSTGGSVGMHDKSISGGEDTATRQRVAPNREQRAARPETTHPTALNAAAISGLWQVEASCIASREEGTIDIHEISATEFTGDYFGSGKILNGRIVGNRVTFTGHYILDRVWTGTVSGSGTGLRMEGSYTGPSSGSFSGNGNCKFTAKKS
jgi:hypothetical protein